jgi:2,3-bisphosphoglycerate-dependent phosphoglycerate mutase
MRTADLALQAAQIDPSSIATQRDAALNERHYGDLQGLNKDEARKKFGEEQVHLWRRSYDIQPPGGESLKDTLARVRPYFDAQIRPPLSVSKNILVVAHGNSLRAMMLMLEGLSPEQILKVELDTGVPVVYELDQQLKILDKKVLNSYTG